jgi:TPR repeat protein
VKAVLSLVLAGLAALAIVSPAQAQTAVEAGQAALEKGDHAAAQAKLGEACDAGVGRGCMLLGLMHDLGLGVDKNPQNAAQFYRTACDLDELEACVALGSTLAKAGEYEGAAANFRHACEQGAFSGCHESAPSYLLGLGGVDPNPEFSATLYRYACDGGYGASCTGLAGYYRDGIGVTADEATANGLLEKACDLEDDDGCIERAHLFLQSGDVEDRVKALGYFLSACLRGNKTGCDGAQGVEEGKFYPAGREPVP